MLKDLFEAIGKMAVRAHEAKVIVLPGAERDAFVQLPSGELHPVELPPPLTQAEVYDVASIKEAIEAFVEDTEHAVLWYDSSRITLQFDRVDCREYVRFPLEYTQQFRTLMKLPRSFDQRTLLYFLKVELAGLVDPATIAIFRTLDFTRAEEQKGKLSHQDESLGRSVQAGVRATSDIPEFLTLSVPIFAHPDFPFSIPVRISVDVNIAANQIQLTALPDTLSNAMDQALDLVGKVLTDECEVSHVLRGEPSMIK